MSKPDKHLKKIITKSVHLFIHIDWYSYQKETRWYAERVNSGPSQSTMGDLISQFKH